MLKVRLQGTVSDMKWFRQLMEKHDEIEVIRASEPKTNRGTDRYFRVYVEVEKKEE